MVARVGQVRPQPAIDGYNAAAILAGVRQLQVIEQRLRSAPNKGIYNKLLSDAIDLARSLEKQV